MNKVYLKVLVINNEKMHNLKHPYNNSYENG
jgi:hypothetical protein